MQAAALPGQGFRVIILARLSQDASGQTGLQTQDLVSREYALARGWDVVEVAVDRASGEKTQPWERKKAKPWLEDPELRAKYDGILGLRFDRLSRGNDESATEIEQWARQHNKMLLTADGLFFPCEGEDGIRWDLAKRLAHSEWLRTSERYTRMQNYLRGEYLVGKPPWGFIAIPKDGHKTLAIDPALEPYLMEVINRVLAGDTFSSVCKWLDDAGMKPKLGGKWHTKSLTQVLRNPCLKGRQVDANGKTILKFEGLINSREFAMLQEALSDRPTKRGPSSGKVALLTGIAMCAKCKRPLYQFRTHNAHKDGTRYDKRYYRCKGTDQEPSTCRVMVPAPLLEDRVNDFFTSDGWFGDGDMYRVTTTAGHGYEDEIKEREDGILALDPIYDPDYLAKRQTLLDEIEVFRGLPVRKPEVMKEALGIKVKNYWLTLNTQEKRQYLLDAHVKIYAQMIWEHEADRYRRIPGRLDAVPDGNPSEVARVVRKTAES
jgi:hypothetical protein